MEEQQLEFNDNEIQNAFISILSAKNVDIRDKKSAIIDFIAAGIETVSHPRKSPFEIKNNIFV